MGCRIIVGSEQGSDSEVAVFYCSTTGIAFGPVFQGTDDLVAEDEAEQFIKWLEDHPTNRWRAGKGFEQSTDPRAYPVSELMDLYAQFRKEQS